MDNASTFIQQKALKSKAHVQCYGCANYGHYKKECRSQKRVQYGDKGAKFAAGSHEKLLYTRTKGGVRTVMVIDSGASCHMMADKTLFSSVTSVEPRIIALGDGNKIHADKMGRVNVPTLESEHSTKSLVLNRVLYVPDLDTNLISCAALDMDGYTTYFGNSRCEIRLNDKVMCTGKLLDGLYALEPDPSQDSALVAKNHTEAEKLWHRRFGHVYKRTLKDMASRGNVAGMHFN